LSKLNKKCHIIGDHQIQRFPKATSIESWGNASHQATETKKMERRTSFHLKTRKKMESHMTFHLESKNQDPSKVHRDGVSRAEKGQSVKNQYSYNLYKR
jgi:hypothetical protein